MCGPCRTGQENESCHKVWLKDKIVLGERYKRGEGEVEWRGVRK